MRPAKASGDAAGQHPWPTEYPFGHARHHGTRLLLGKWPRTPRPAKLPNGVPLCRDRVHTETCDPDTPHLITAVATTPATTQDDQLLPTIHSALKARDLLPSEHLVDAGYTTAEVLVTSRREHGVTVVGPVTLDGSWQARAGEGFDKARFTVDWDTETVTCPPGSGVCRGGR